MAHSLYFVGTAGAGKSTLTGVFAQWLQDAKVSVATVNLDPGVVLLPYSPDVDVRDYVSLQEVMGKYNLGPNGGLIAAIDLMSAHLETLEEEINDLGTDFILFDAPGQIELFAFRETGPVIVSSIGGDSKMILFLVDSALARTPAGFVSSLLLSASVLVRFNLPQLNVLSRADLLSEDELERLMTWLDDVDQLVFATEESRNKLQSDLTNELYRALQRLFAGSNVTPVSSKTLGNLDVLYTQISNSLTGGEGFERFR
ncbi:MAG: ATP/GTP-binding protein [Promethearchaeota archaeon]